MTFSEYTCFLKEITRSFFPRFSFEQHTKRNPQLLPDTKSFKIFWTPTKFTVNILKFKTKWFYNGLIHIHPNNANGTANMSVQNFGLFHYLENILIHLFISHCNVKNWCKLNYFFICAIKENIQDCSLCFFPCL